MNPSDTTTFEIGQQSGQSISNIGGDQTINYGERSGAARVGKILGALGLFLSIVGVVELSRPSRIICLRHGLRRSGS